VVVSERIHFLPHDAMLARYSLLCHGSVVYPSVTSRSSTETAERIELGFFLGGGAEDTLDFPTLYHTEIQVSLK